MKSLYFSLMVIFVLTYGFAGSAVHLDRAKSLPSNIDNSQNPQFRPIFEHLGHNCSHASGIAYVFTYEINRLRGLASDNEDTQYPYVYTADFLNGGNESASLANYFDAWAIAQATGIPTATDFGGFTNGFPTRWMNGYEKYYNAMHNRVQDVFSIQIISEEKLNELKQYLYDHGDGSDMGGLVSFKIFCTGWQIREVPSGTPEEGRSIIVKFGNRSDHCMTIVGYNDSVRYDCNGDGMYTNDVDLNNDGEITIQDWEIGAVLVANSWGTQRFGEEGFAYALYRALALPLADGGIQLDNNVSGVIVNHQYIPQLTYKFSITHNTRNAVKLSAGIADDIQASEPEKVRSFAGAFNYSGGAFPMEGEDLSATIEIGLDVTDFLDSVSGNEAKFFLQIESRGGTGTVNSFSLLDYSGSTVREFTCTDTDVPIASGQTTLLSIVHNDLITEIVAKPQNFSGKLTAFPGSNGRGVTFRFPASGIESAVLYVFNVHGKVVYKKTINTGLTDSNHGFYTLESGFHSGTSAKGIYVAVVKLRRYNGLTDQLKTVFCMQK